LWEWLPATSFIGFSPTFHRDNMPLPQKESQFSPEGPMLEGGEERVQLCQRGAVRGFQPVHC